MPQLNQITPAQLIRLIGLPDAPVIVDVRIPEDIAADPRLIPGSFLLTHDGFDPAPATLLGQRVVVVCQKGRKLSEGVAALLRTQGIDAQVLEGGSMAWAEASLPMLPIKSLPPSNLWVTRHRPKIDRIACPWLIRRFIDPTARFLFVAPSEVQSVADRFNATPFDIEDTFFSHRGDTCTFDTLLKEFALHTEALQRLAQVVRAADTDRHDLSPQAAGLLAISVGLSRQYRDDLEQLSVGMTLYDALYRWARDGHEEGHDWPAGRAQ
ncbi:sulfurtransferase/chromate resistance protein [Cypionkella sp.]|uniref:sulfurtransferase/chromate resistance protein n=1 Tax=Cypionkella sp. TaxID=2811411 RepID=UPI002AB8E918|nr:sulfurtransferase/chromate resistance protein [Cypionkella sp.]MDZ4393054.1 sulfurtransferase/chromate resistance protein [Cypionkella sp.]